MKDYHDMLNSLKDKVIDAAGKAGETVTNAANKVVSDEMRDKVAGAAHAVGDRAKYASRMTRMTVDCNAELERVKRITPRSVACTTKTTATRPTPSSPSSASR